MNYRKYFIVTPEASLYDDFYDWKKNVKAVNDVVRDIKTKFDINGGEYIITDSVFVVEDTKENREKFAEYICKTSVRAGGRDEWGLRIKKTSPIWKELRLLLKDKGLTVKEKPWLPLYFQGACGTIRSALFDYDGKVYANIEMDVPINVPEGFDEISEEEYRKIYDL